MCGLEDAGDSAEAVLWCCIRWESGIREGDAEEGKSSRAGMGAKAGGDLWPAKEAGSLGERAGEPACETLCGRRWAGAGVLA